MKTPSSLAMDSIALDSSVVSRLQLITELAQGGMATVYLAALRGSAGFHRLVVLKMLRNDLACEDADVYAMFLKEAQLTGRMQHPNIAQTIDVGHSNGRTFLVMEYLEGQSLHAVSRRAGQSPSAWSLGAHLHVLSQALAGLHHAHELRDYDGRPFGIVHRDVTPQNVFITYDGAVKLIDFGVAKAQVSDVRTHLGVLKGKISYMSPEQASGGAVDRRADVFSVGVMLYEALTGRRMWRGYTELEVLRDLAVGKVPDVHAAAPHVPRVLRDICAKALAVRPDDRHATAGELQTELRGWLEQSGDGGSARDLGNVVSDLFSRERQQIRCLVDSYMRGTPMPSSSMSECNVASAGPRSVSAASKTRDEAPPLAATASRTAKRTARGSARAVAWTCACLGLGVVLVVAASRETVRRSSSSVSVGEQGNAQSAEVLNGSEGACGIERCKPGSPQGAAPAASTMAPSAAMTVEPARATIPPVVPASQVSTLVPREPKIQGSSVSRAKRGPVKPSDGERLRQAAPAQAPSAESLPFSDTLSLEPGPRQVRPIDTTNPFQ